MHTHAQARRAGGLAAERRELDQGTDRVVFFEREADLLRSFWDRIGAAVERGGEGASVSGKRPNLNTTCRSPNRA